MNEFDHAFESLNWAKDWADAAQKKGKLTTMHAETVRNCEAAVRRAQAKKKAA